MPQYFLLLLLYAPLLLTTAPATATPTPSVRAVIFVSPACVTCRDLYAYLLPALGQRFGNRLELTEVDVTQPAGSALFKQALASPWQGVPVVVVGKRTLVGVDGIAQGLGDGFEGLAADPASAKWPELNGLAALLPEGMRTLQAKLATLAPPPPPAGDWRSRFLQDRVGNGLAIVVLFLMVLVFAHILVRLRRGVTSNTRIANRLLPWVFLLGSGISAYTAYAALAGVAPVCGPVGDCITVQSSVYSHIFGIPLGIFGLLAYGAILVSWLLAGRFSPGGGGWWHWLPWAIALSGFMFSLRLTTLEPFFIGATCLWCLGSALSMTATLWLLTGAILQRKNTP